MAGASVRLGPAAAAGRMSPGAVRRSAEATIGERFPLHEPVGRRLGRGRQRVLVVQNVADGQGDEIIRVVPLLEAPAAAPQT